MRFVFGKQDMLSLDRTQERCWLLPNGLGGYMSTYTHVTLPTTPYE